MISRCHRHRPALRLSLKGSAIILTDKGVVSIGPRPDDRGNLADQQPAGANPPRFKWGRDQISRKWIAFPGLMLIVPPASMGPRPDDRGNGSQAKPGITRLSLQWGRDQMIAEMVDTNALPSSGERASMGPRPDDRGNDAPMRVYLSPTFSFNGAATR